jgi:hypothetical protein
MPETADAALATRSDLNQEAVKNITGALNALLADAYALYFKAKIFIGTLADLMFVTLLPGAQRGGKAPAARAVEGM